MGDLGDGGDELGRAAGGDVQAEMRLWLAVLLAGEEGVLASTVPEKWEKSHGGLKFPMSALASKRVGLSGLFKHWPDVVRIEMRGNDMLLFSPQAGGSRGGGTASGAAAGAGGGAVAAAGAGGGAVAAQCHGAPVPCEAHLVKSWLKDLLEQAGESGVAASLIPTLWLRDRQTPFSLQALGYSKRQGMAGMLAAWPDIAIAANTGLSNVHVYAPSSQPPPSSPAAASLATSEQTQALSQEAPPAADPPALSGDSGDGSRAMRDAPENEPAGGSNAGRQNPCTRDDAEDGEGRRVVRRRAVGDGRAGEMQDASDVSDHNINNNAVHAPARPHAAGQDGAQMLQQQPGAAGGAGGAGGVGAAMNGGGVAAAVQVREDHVVVRDWLVARLREAGRTGINASQISSMWEAAVGAPLNIKGLGFSKVSKMLEAWSDIARVEKDPANGMMVFASEEASFEDAGSAAVLMGKFRPLIGGGRSDEGPKHTGPDVFLKGSAAAHNVAGLLSQQETAQIYGMGYNMLNKMGYTHGMGAGAQKEGLATPLELGQKMDKKGLAAEGESTHSRGASGKRKRPEESDGFSAHHVKGWLLECAHSNPGMNVAQIPQLWSDRFLGSLPVKRLGHKSLAAMLGQMRDAVRTEQPTGTIALLYPASKRFSIPLPPQMLGEAKPPSAPSAPAKAAALYVPAASKMARPTVVAGVSSSSDSSSGRARSTGAGGAGGGQRPLSQKWTLPPRPDTESVSSEAQPWFSGQQAYGGGGYGAAFPAGGGYDAAFPSPGSVYHPHAAAHYNPYGAPPGGIVGHGGGMQASGTSLITPQQLAQQPQPQIHYAQHAQHQQAYAQQYPPQPHQPHQPHQPQAYSQTQEYPAQPQGHPQEHPLQAQPEAQPPPYSQHSMEGVGPGPGAQPPAYAQQPHAHPLQYPQQPAQQPQPHPGQYPPQASTYPQQQSWVVDPASQQQVWAQDPSAYQDPAYGDPAYQAGGGGGAAGYVAHPGWGLWQAGGGGA